MNIEEIKAFLESNKDQPEVAAYLEELSAVSADKVKGFLDTDEGKRLIQPILDKYHSKSLESWKANNLEKLVEAEIAKRNPQKSPAEIEVEKLRKEIEDERKARARQEIYNKAMKQATEKNLPVDLLDYFVSDDEEKTSENLSKLEEVFTKAVQTGVESKFKENGRDVHKGTSNGANEDYGKKIAQEYIQDNQGIEEAQNSYFS
ncbi:DUF4355 domain-containing protein [Bacillus thermotolerans]|uniref:Phage protein n=1 Tax=Bacillus thermotolerans TaxID=1221996 RepID=A0A0F5HYY0_BACTR|nr:DUF4355 domain-containing protein [Bacillus thermotolerans]KKB34637.1 Phage protein [Bacillus thermotolerans]KKB38589.1 Phage protein [Bacillus thermotolerans]